jgi:hypothetical protein
MAVEDILVDFRKAISARNECFIPTTGVKGALRRWSEIHCELSWAVFADEDVDEEEDEEDLIWPSKDDNTEDED